jgi:hypothetical protein
MPIENQEPQRDQDVVAYTVFSGLRNDVSPERFNAGDLAVADNVDIDKTGRVSRRSGYTQQVAGASHSLWANDQGTLAFFMQGNVLFQLNDDYSTTQIAVLRSTARVWFEQVNDRVYFSNGLDTGIIEQGGAARSWGVAPPALPDVAIDTGGNMFAGTYLFTMTWLCDDGQESGSRTAATVQIPEDGGAITFTGLPIPTDPRIVAKAIYLTEANGEDMMQALLVPANATSATYLNDGTELNLPCDSQFLQAAPAGQIVAYYRGRMWVANGNLLCPSEPFAYERFDPRQYMELDGRITLLASLTDKELYDTGKNSGFFIGTDRSCGVLIGSSPEDFQYVPKTSYGAIFGAVDKLDGSVFEDGSTGTLEIPAWLTTDGICVGMPGMVVRNLTRTKYTFPVGTRGAGLFMPGPNRLILTNQS